jgi:hypothetical protein
VSDDAELVRRALARDAGAFRAIMQKHNRRLYRIARGVLKNNADAEDAVQDAYVSSLQSGKPDRPEVEAAVRTIIRWSGDNPDRGGLIETPARVTRAFEGPLSATLRTRS